MCVTPPTGIPRHPKPNVRNRRMRPNSQESPANGRYSPTRPRNDEETGTLVSIRVCSPLHTSNRDACHAEGRGFESHHPLSVARAGAMCFLAAALGDDRPTSGSSITTCATSERSMFWNSPTSHAASNSSPLMETSTTARSSSIGRSDRGTCAWLVGVDEDRPVGVCPPPR